MGNVRFAIVGSLGASQNRQPGSKTHRHQHVNFSLRKLIKARASFPNDEAAIKLLYLGLRNISQRWTMPIHNWKQAMSQFMIHFEKQFNQA